ncbi:hypothetical protein LCGC14_2842310 [marine sediment metagenome]|uniref:Uncharacterized protein n=1 Tax=marine sediment metagenome TaxID=412755 RepID=A0A0F8YB13_9ZZZZ
MVVTIEDERALRALDKTRLHGQFNAFLADRVSQPLHDAIDAMTFDPPRYDVARQRIEMVLLAIEQR